ncbi:MAG: CoA transferase, partial [Ilumatobacteraceae bacterium]
AFRAQDGYFVLAAGNDRLWHAVCEIVDRPQWREDPRFVTTALRAAHQSELKALLEEVFIGQPAAAWLAACRGAGIPCSPIQNYEQALSDPQAEHLELVCPLPLPEGGVSKTVGCPVRLNGEMLPVGSAVPPLAVRAPPRLPSIVVVPVEAVAVPVPRLAATVPPCSA